MAWPGLGSNFSGSELESLINDFTSGMGDFVTAEVGSLAWCEAYVCARLIQFTLEFSRLMAEQLEPNESTIYLPRWQQIYLNFSNPQDFRNYVAQIQKQINTIPNLNNIYQFLATQLGSVFQGLEWIPLQIPTYATFSPPTTTQPYNSVVSRVLVHCYQLRDNNDNLLISNAAFDKIINSYQQITQDWIPINATLSNVVLGNAGGNGNGNAVPYGGFNVPINITSGSSIVTSTLSSANSTFETDFIHVFNGPMTYQPLEVVDDNNQVHTVYVASVQSNTQLTLTQAATFNATARTYRTYGFRCNITPTNITAVN